MVARRRRSGAFKLNVKKFGLDKAKLIAACVTRKQKGLWRETDKSKKRFKNYKKDVNWFVGESWNGPVNDENSNETNL